MNINYITSFPSCQAQRDQVGFVFYTGGGGRKRLPKFKFLAKFPIGLHVILQIQIKKIRKWLLYYVKNYFNRKSVEVQPCTPLEIMLNGFYLKIIRQYVCCTCNGRVSRCCHIESSWPPPLVLYWEQFKCVTCSYIDKFAPFHNQMSVIHNIFVKISINHIFL